MKSISDLHLLDYHFNWVLKKSARKQLKHVRITRRVSAVRVSDRDRRRILHIFIQWKCEEEEAKRGKKKSWMEK